MSKRDKLRLLTAQVGHDRYTVPVYEAAAGNRCVPLFKTLMSSFCQNNCKFCSFRGDRRQRRERWEPHELARVAMKVWREGWVSGLFISSGVEGDPDATVEREIEAVDILRRMGFTGYVHLRLMPGVDRELIRRAVEISDRVGINLEFPRAEYYNDMKIHLDYRQDLIKRIELLAREVRGARERGRCRAGLDTQMILGASDETDKEVLETSEWVYTTNWVHRGYTTPRSSRSPTLPWKVRDRRINGGSIGSIKALS